MPHRVLRLVSCLPLVMTACDKGEPRDDTGLAAGMASLSPSRAPAALAPAVPANSCSAPGSSAKRYVAIVDGPAACTGVTHWSATPLFRQANASELWNTLEAAGTAMPDPLGRFCVYAWTGPGDPANGPTVGQCTRMDPDPDLVVPQSGTLANNPAFTTLRQTQADQTIRGLGAAPSKAGVPPATWPYGAPEGLPYVAVVDTADSRAPGAAVPSYGTAGAPQTHGLSMQALIDEVRCPYDQPNCLARQFTAQAFPHDASHHTPQVPGGQQGSLGSLASAIGEAVARWKTLPDSGSSKLIVNLSVGWDPASADLVGDPSGLLAAPSNSVSAPLQAMYVALSWASCEGALPVAASGNNRGRLCEQQGPMAPGAWERLEAPGNGCGELGLGAGPAGVPLVYAAGGLDAGDQPIVNTRRDSLPQRALYAHQGVMAVDGGQFTAPWTGTSISTAGLSAIAAAVWSYRPTDSASSIMNAIDAQGQSLTLTANILPDGQPSGGVKRLDAHSVFQHASLQAAVGPRNPYAPRPSLGASFGTSSLSAPLDALHSSTLTSLGGMPEVATLTANTDPESCSPQNITVYSMAGGAGHPDPIDNLSDETRPQPHVPICPTCVVHKESDQSSSSGSGLGGLGTIATATPATLSGHQYTLHLEFDPHYTSGASNPTLILRDPAGGYVAVDLGISSLTVRQEVDLANYRLGSDPGAQTLADWLGTRTSVTSGTISLDVGTGPNAQTIGQAIDIVH